MSLKLHLPFPHPRFLSSYLLKKRKVRLIRVVLFWFRLCLCPRMNYDHLHHTDNFSTTFKQEANRTNWHYWLINTGQSRQTRATWVSSRVSSRQTRPISLHELYLIHWTDKQLLTWLGWWFPLTRTIRVQDQGLLKQCNARPARNKDVWARANKLGLGTWRTWHAWRISFLDTQWFRSTRSFLIFQSCSRK